jgi:hypothetical protein
VPDVAVKDLSKQLNSLVPDLYYDLISRVIPGIAIVTILISLAKGWGDLGRTLATLSIGSATIFVAAIGTMGYLSGMLCLPVGEFVRYLLTPFLWRAVVSSSKTIVIKAEEEFGFPGLHSTWRPSMINMAYRVIHEKLRSTGERTIVLSKMQAESAQCAVLVGFFLLLLTAISLGHCLPQTASTILQQSGVLWVGVVGFSLSFLALIFRSFRLWNRHLSKLHESLRSGPVSNGGAPA